MSLSEYFDPISLEKPDEEIFSNKNLFCKHITIHTPDTPLSGISGFQIAIVGVPEYRSSKNPDIANAPDKIREQLYKLNFPDRKISIIDLGNLKLGKEVRDTYFGLRDVILELLSYNVFPVVIGGSQDLTYGMTLAFEALKDKYTLTAIDYKSDLAFETYQKILPGNYLNSIILESNYLFEYINIGHQACFLNIDGSNLFEDLFHETLRLGIVRNNTILSEPYLRDTTILSIDISSIKNADAPGQSVASPNGFSAEEICQMARYAGFGEKLKVLGLFELVPSLDHNNVTAALMAQIVWYFLEGYSFRIHENPESDPEQLKQYIISYDEANTLTFYKSQLTQRWWCEVPTKDPAKPLIISCREEDYLSASREELPDRWMKFFKKMN